MKLVSSEEPGSRYSVQVLKGGGEYGPAVSLCWNERLDEFAELYYSLVLIRNSERTILINTGMPDDFGAFESFIKAWHPRCRLFREESEKPAAALASAGVKPEQVETVILTP